MPIRQAIADFIDSLIRSKRPVLWNSFREGDSPKQAKRKFNRIIDLGTEADRPDIYRMRIDDIFAGFPIMTISSIPRLDGELLFFNMYPLEKNKHLLSSVKLYPHEDFIKDGFDSEKLDMAYKALVVELCMRYGNSPDRYESKDGGISAGCTWSSSGISISLRKSMRAHDFFARDFLSVSYTAHYLKNYL